MVVVGRRWQPSAVALGLPEILAKLQKRENPWRYNGWVEHIPEWRREIHLPVRGGPPNRSFPSAGSHTSPESSNSAPHFALLPLQFNISLCRSFILSGSLSRRLFCPRVPTSTTSSRRKPISDAGEVAALHTVARRSRGPSFSLTYAATWWWSELHSVAARNDW